MSFVEKTLVIALGSVLSCTTAVSAQLDRHIQTQSDLQELLDQRDPIVFSGENRIQVINGVWNVNAGGDVSISGDTRSLLTLKGSAEHKAALNVTGFTNLHMQSLSDDHNQQGGLIHLETANTELNLKGSDGNFFNSLTLEAIHGPAISATPTENWVGKSDTSSDSHDDPHTKANIGIFAMHSTISTKSGTAIFLNGAGTADGSRADLEFKRNENADTEQTLTIFSPDKAVVAENGGGFMANINKIDIQGSVKLEDGGWMQLGIPDISQLPDDWLKDGFEGESSVLLESVSIVSDNDDPTIRLEDAGFISISSQNINIVNKKQQGKAIEIDFKGLDNEDVDETDLIVDIYATNELKIVGDIIIEGHDVPRNGYIQIGADDNAKVQIDGNISISCNEASTSVVRLNLPDGAVFNGNIDFQKPTASDKALRNLSLLAESNSPQHFAGLSLGQDANWHINGSTNLTEVKSNGSDIHIQEGGSLNVENLINGKNGTNIIIDKYSAEKPFIAAKNNQGDGLLITLKDGNGLSGFSTEEKKAAILNLQQFDQTDSYKIIVEESRISGQITVDVDDKNNAVFNMGNNSVTESLNDIASNQLLAWRAQTNDVNKRLGDLRTYQGLNGAWVRVFGSKDKFKDRNLESEQTTVQIGADTRLVNNYYFGLTTSYTDGEGSLNNGTSDDTAYGFGLYGGWMSDHGHFIDVIVKRYRMESDFNLRYLNGDHSEGNFHTWGTSLSAEYGYRYNTSNNTFWVEPQFEMTLGHVDSVDYLTSAGVRASQDSMDSVIARLGCAVGMNLNQGSAYAKLSVAHDWDGKTVAHMNDGLDHSSTPQDLSGSWGEFAIGGTWNLNGAVSAYGELQTAFGSPVDTPYQWNVGMRYSF